MPDGSSFRIDQMPGAMAAIRDLREAARGSRRTMDLATALLEMTRRLKSDPFGVGEPRRNTKKAGGFVHFAILNDFAISFAIYPDEKVVVLLSFAPYGDRWKNM
jgi:hypothetical protein